MKVCLYVGCWGLEHAGITLCPGCENEVMDLSDQTERNIAIADYLDSNYGLIDRPLYNNVHTAVFNIQEKFSKKGSPIFTKDRFAALERFCVMHVRCGLFLRLKIKEGEDDPQKRS